VAREMAREGLTLPLLIGGATTSRVHTAVKIAPAYPQPVIHVLDASRAVGVVSQLISTEQRPAFVRKTEEEYQLLRQRHQVQLQKPLLAIGEARGRKPRFAWDDYTPPKPAFLGARDLSSARSKGNTAGQEEITLEMLLPFIDWSPFFHTWEIRGRYPALLDDPKAKEVFDDAQKLLRKIVSKRLLTARGVYGFFPANSFGDDVRLYSDESRQQVLADFHFLRQQADKTDGSPNWCLADFVAPGSPQSGKVTPDYLGAFAVSAGFGVEDLCSSFERQLDDYNSIMVKALADRLAEAFAEYLHQRAREDWGYGQAEALSHEELIREKYRGIRPAAGYPASPDHTEKWTLWKLLGVEERTGIRLTESCAMWPGASVSGLYFSHPDSRYFAVGKIGRDQVLEYQGRKGLSLDEVEKWLGPYLSYDPGAAAPVRSAASCGCQR
jgi:5-methyltetrahydrofolate--homocysteine methyltransferase